LVLIMIIIRKTGGLKGSFGFLISLEKPNR
jgi:hypothetical protein